MVGYGMAAAVQWGVHAGQLFQRGGAGFLGHCQRPGLHPGARPAGMWGIFQVFVSTFLVCTMTALAMLTPAWWTWKPGGCSPCPGPRPRGRAFSAALGPLGPGFVAGAVLLFAWSSVLGWSQYGAECWAYLFGPGTVWAYRLAFLALILPGATAGFTAAWALSDTFNGLMMLPNLAGLSPSPAR